MIISNHTGNQVTKSTESKKPDREEPIKDTLVSEERDTQIPQLLEKYKKHQLLKEPNEKEKPWWAESADACHVQGDVINGLGVEAGKLANASTALSGFGAIGLGAFGVMEMKEGIKEKDSIKIAKGGSEILAGAASGADVLVKAAPGLFGAAGETIAHVAEPLATVFGVVHGTIDLVLGGRDLIHGIKEKNQDDIVDGSMNMGIGSTMIMLGVGLGGPVTAAILGTLFVVKEAYDHRKGIAKFGKKIINKIKDKFKPEAKQDITSVKTDEKAQEKKSEDAGVPLQKDNLA